MTRYLDLYDHLKKVRCSPAAFQEIKLRYAEKIASTRQLDRCKTVADILTVLEKRDEINPDNYNILEDLFVYLRDPLEPQRPTSPPLPDPGRQDVRILPVVPTQLNEKLQYIIGCKIGHNWKTFARGLGIPEGQIDQLEDRHRNISDRVRDVLVYHEQFCPRNFRNSYLYNALCFARRRDLAIEIQYIIDTY